MALTAKQLADMLRAKGLLLRSDIEPLLGGSWPFGNWYGCDLYDKHPQGGYYCVAYTYGSRDTQWFRLKDDNTISGVAR